jgi:hypothetical protein
MRQRYGKGGREEGDEGNGGDRKKLAKWKISYRKGTGK